MRKILSLSRLTGGFTMIELLIVISILGILAVVVLSAINPIEQINRGRDTGSKSDAEQMISATERYTANRGYYPWQTTATVGTQPLAVTAISTADPLDDGGTCSMLVKLGQGTPNPVCLGGDELKESYINRIDGLSGNPARQLYIYNRGTATSDSTYVCFSPQSKEFETQAADRCALGAPADVDAAVWTASFCPAAGADNVAGEPKPMVCLP